MSMYLPNPDLQPTGFEPAEFTDIVHSPRAHTRDQQGEPLMDIHSGQFGPAYLRGMPASSRTDATTARRPLSDQTRINITRWAQEYISGLVRNHNGDSDDVRSIIDDLHAQSTLIFNGV
jgi:hypothetical protein